MRWGKVIPQRSEEPVGKLQGWKEPGTFEKLQGQCDNAQCMGAERQELRKGRTWTESMQDPIQACSEVRAYVQICEQLCGKARLWGQINYCVKKDGAWGFMVLKCKLLPVILSNTTKLCPRFCFSLSSFLVWPNFTCSLRLLPDSLLSFPFKLLKPFWSSQLLLSSLFEQSFLYKVRWYTAGPEYHWLPLGHMPIPNQLGPGVMVWKWTPDLA